MSIVSNYVCEGCYYSVNELQSMFQFDLKSNETFKNFIKDLLGCNILKKKKEKTSDVGESFFENYNDSELTRFNEQYRFNFVGIVICQNRIVYVYPKYIGRSKKIPPEQLQLEMRQVIRVIEKYSKEKSRQDIRDISFMVDSDDNGKINLLSVMLFLLEDYAVNGVYNYDEEIVEVNGDGDILWQKTIDETYPVISGKRPYYVEFYTKRNVVDDVDFLRRLHEYVVTQCSYQIANAGLTDFFSLSSIEISDDEQDVFGDNEYIIERIERRLSETYDDRKNRVLKALLLYFKSSKILVGDMGIQLIGTRSFYAIWEEVCVKVFGSQKLLSVDKIQPDIDYNAINMNFSNRPPALVELIKQPVWKKWGRGNQGIQTKTFNPDYLKFEKREHSDCYEFYILDAKYYCPDWNDRKIVSQPGIEDIVKQYMYHLAYLDVLKKNKVRKVKNYFLMPKKEGDNEQIGFVKLDIMKNIGLDVIEVRMLSPKEMYKNYLDNTQLPLSYLH